MCNLGNEVSLLYPAQKVLCFQAADDNLLRRFTVRLDYQSPVKIMLDICDTLPVKDKLPVGPEEVIAVQHVL